MRFIHLRQICLLKVNRMKINRISQQRFEAFVSYTRTPQSIFFAHEFDWYATEDERLLGLLTQDKIDIDFGFVVFGRDEALRFRYIDGDTSIPTVDEAMKRLFISMEKHTATGQTIFPQGDVEQKERINLFEPVVLERNLNKNFLHLKDSLGFSPAKEIILEMIHHYFDVDGNFVEQFQTHGFDARLWELYLFAFLNEERLFIDRNFSAPDYVVSRFDEPVCIEAVTVNPSKSGVLAIKKEPKSADEVRELLDDYMPIKFGSVLFSKLNKRYWEIDHVNGKSLIIAVADFHDECSMTWSSSALFEYLYGVRQKYHYENGKLIVENIPIENHEFKGKLIPSNFFGQPEVENISAILFSASATISKFNRIGKLAGFGSPDVHLIRMGDYHDHDPNASKPIRESRQVEADSYSETWGEGLSMYHNPNAKYPVDPETFPSIAHHFFEDGKIISNLPDIHPYASITLNLVGEK